MPTTNVRTDPTMEAKPAMTAAATSRSCDPPSRELREPQASIRIEGEPDCAERDPAEEELASITSLNASWSQAGTVVARASVEDQSQANGH